MGNTRMDGWKMRELKSGLLNNKPTRVVCSIRAKEKEEGVCF